MAQQYNENVDNLIKHAGRLFKDEVISEYQYNFIVKSLNKMEVAKPEDSTLNLISNSNDPTSFRKDYALYTNTDKYSKNINLNNLGSFRLKTQNNLYLGFVDDKLTLLTHNEVLTNSVNQINTIMNVERILDNQNNVLNHFYLRFEGFNNSNNYLTLGDNDTLIISKKNNLKSLWKLSRHNNFFNIESIFQKNYYVDTSQMMKASSGKSETTKWIIEEITSSNNTNNNVLFTVSDRETKQILSRIDFLIDKNTSNNQEILEIIRKITILNRNQNNPQNQRIKRDLNNKKNNLTQETYNQDTELEDTLSRLDELINEKKSQISNVNNINQNISKKINDINQKNNQFKKKREINEENLRILERNLEILKGVDKTKRIKSRTLKYLSNGIIFVILLFIIVIISRFILK